jgi:hypothetical protein
MLEIAALIATIINKIFPDKDKQGDRDFQLKKELLAKELQDGLLDAGLIEKQLDINIEEAKHSSIFVAGWRPFIGWVCGIAFAWQYVLCPVLTFLLVVSGQPIPVMPTFGIETMIPVLFGMLGLGGLRTYEKLKGK